MSRHKPSRYLIAVREDAQRNPQRRGAYTVVAQKLGLTPAHVRNVAVGLRSSKRVEEALDAELRKRARRSQKFEVAA